VKAQTAAREEEARAHALDAVEAAEAGKQQLQQHQQELQAVDLEVRAPLARGLPYLFLDPLTSQQLPVERANRKCGTA